MLPFINADRYFKRREKPLSTLGNIIGKQENIPGKISPSTYHEPSMSLDFHIIIYLQIQAFLERIEF